MPEQFKALADKAGIYKLDMKAAALAWLAKEFALDHGHLRAICAVFKDKGWVDATKEKK